MGPVPPPFLLVRIPWSILIFMRKSILFALLTWAVSASAYDGPGTSSFAVLRESYEAKAIGMGEAFSSVAEGAGALHWNPAGLAETAGRELLLGYRSLPMQVQGGVPALARRFGSYGLAVSAEYLNYGDIEVYDEIGRADSGSPAITPFSFSATAGVGRKFGKKLSAGLAVRGVYEKLHENEIAQKGLGLDFGVRYIPDFRRTSLAFVVQNLGYNTTEESLSLPVVFRFGASSIFAPFPKTRFALDVVKPIEDVFDYRIGMDYRYSRTFSLRAGYSISQPELERLINGTDEDSSPERAQSWSLGAGYKAQRFTFDYAIQSWSLLGLTHAVSLSFAL